MTNEEQHEREMNMNAHFQWSMAFWGSGEAARESGNLLLAPIGYYYSAFHSAFAMMNTDHSVQLESLKRMRHSRLQAMVESRLDPLSGARLALLRDVRETMNYLGADSAAHKMGVIHGHPFGFELSPSRRLDYRSTIELARTESLKFFDTVLQFLEYFCHSKDWRGPKWDNPDWLDEYFHEDYLLSVIPREKDGSCVLLHALSLLDGDGPLAKIRTGGS
jgi:hypothetical protein